MKTRTVKRLLIAACMLALIVAVFAVSAYACTTIYVGGNLAEDGVPIVARSEDYINSASKLMYISPSGQYKAGEKYIGCEEYGGFEWTWTHDSYRFDAYTADVFFKTDEDGNPVRKTYVCDDDGRIIFDGVCPECGKPGHPSYTEHGTNEKGVTVSSTETISPTRQIRNVDPFKTEKVDGKVGIEETDIPTVILSECATAREGITLLLKIYDECGCANGAGLFIADQKEIWYVENTTGTQYIALKLNNDLLFLEPNMPVIGLIDLDDENVIASKNLIAVAKEAGTFVGNEEENQIDYRASYSNAASVNARMVNGLNFLNKEYSYDTDALKADTTAFTISNVKDGAIVPVYTNITADRKLTIDDVVNYYKLPSIGNTGNTDTCLFQIYPDRPVETGTVQWTSMDHGSYNVFIPCYPVLLDGLYVGYGSSIGEATKRLTEKPEGIMYYASQGRDGKVTYTAFPKGWDKSFYWTFDALSNLILYKGVDRPAVTEEELNFVLDTFKDLQDGIYEAFAEENELIKSLGLDAARDIATDYYGTLSMIAHEACLELVDYLTTGFLDVHEETYYGEPVKWAVEKEITNGTSDKIFSPFSDCTRAQAVTFLWRAAGKPEPTSTVNPFEDVAADAYYYKAVLWAVENGITNGTSATTFRPDQTCTRAQIVTFLWRASGRPEPTTVENPFTDVAVDQYYYKAVQWAVENGVTTGTSETRFSPDFTCTRAQIVTFLYRNLYEPELEEGVEPAPAE